MTGCHTGDSPVTQDRSLPDQFMPPQFMPPEHMGLDSHYPGIPKQRRGFRHLRLPNTTLRNMQRRISNKMAKAVQGDGPRKSSNHSNTPDASRGSDALETRAYISDGACKKRFQSSGKLAQHQLLLWSSREDRPSLRKPGDSVARAVH